MLSIVGQERAAARLLAAADEELRRANFQPLPELPPQRVTSVTEALQRSVGEARCWALGMSGDNLARRMPRFLRPLVRLLLLPVRIVNWPQRRFNLAVLATLEALQHAQDKQEAQP